MSEDRTEAARLLALARPKVGYTCAQCGQTFAAVGRKRPGEAKNLPRFCSATCRWTWHNARRAERKAATPPAPEGEAGGA